ncbi:glycoside hydrolase family 26 protein [Streptomyces enissocaesilis]|uniref:Glycosyl hydrolase n=1 Tax=Streptomyces enissocaesilis TaxID=332589 RepID=A0ABP6J4L8_9ACTN
MSKRRRLTGTCIGTVAISLIVASGVFGAEAADRAPTDPPVPAPATPEPEPEQEPKPDPEQEQESRVPAIGAYLHYGPEGVERMAELSKWLGGAELKVGHTYLPGDLWSNIEGRPEFLRPWAEWRRGADDRMFVLNVPMLERNEARVPDDEVRDLLQEGAAGSYDAHYRTLANRLVDLGAKDTVIVLGWEMNGTTYTHRCGPDPDAWKAYWKRIVKAMRSVPGQEFRFDFAPNRGVDAIPWTECYPGDDVVDIIGMDSYDQPPGETFDEHVSGPYGLQAQVDFAAAHNKAISYPEWGLFRNGDNPEYMSRMLDWMARHKPLYQTITDYCPHGVWQCDENPESSEVFRSKLYGTPGQVPPAPAPTPADPVEGKPDRPAPAEPPHEPNSDDWCAPVKLGDWINQWVPDFRFCVKSPPSADRLLF